MIKLGLSINEDRAGHLQVHLIGTGDATPLEFEAGEGLRAHIATFMEDLMRRHGNGTGCQRNLDGHGVVALALAIADEDAPAELEGQCYRVQRDGKTWFHTRDVDEESKPSIDRAVQFLKLRGRIEQHPSEAALVRIA